MAEVIAKGSPVIVVEGREITEEALFLLCFQQMIDGFGRASKWDERN